MNRMRSTLLGIVLTSALAASPAWAATITSFGGNYILAGAPAFTTPMSFSSGGVTISSSAGLAGSTVTDASLSLIGFVPDLGAATITPAFTVTGGWGSVSFAIANPGLLQASPITSGGTFSSLMTVTSESGHDFGGVGAVWDFNIGMSFVAFTTGGYTTSQGIAQTAAFNANRQTRTVVPEPGSLLLWGLGGALGLLGVRRRRG